MKLKIVEDNEQLKQIVQNQDKIIKQLREQIKKLKKENNVLINLCLKKEANK